ncbi:hypothetical protein ONZ43_g6000 [Nemania bipapillata]|uniref:Uncharacterized protein n=1 Tax=Nemania bipapillata TaxID=110536 RepID=A0ACC2I4Q9_9PEZI|nr:hypothetical protein ONZ43_g6000 [Nemania bipapillata]
MDWLFDDGVRMMPLDRAEWLGIHDEFCAVLTETGLEHRVLPAGVGTTEERVRFVLEGWEEKWRQLAGDDGEEHESGHAKL